MNKLKEYAYQYYNQALDLLADNDLTNAVKSLKKSIILYSQDTDILNLLGLCYYYQCNFSRAAFFWGQSLSLTGEHNKASQYLEYIRGDAFQQLISKYNRAVDFIHNQQYRQGISLLQEVIDKEKDLIEPRVILGLSYLELGESDKALDHLQSARQMDSGNPQIKDYIIECKNNMSKSDETEGSGESLIYFKYAAIAIIITLITITGFQYYHYQNKISSYQAEVKNHEKRLTTVKDKKKELYQQQESLTNELDQVKADKRKLANMNSALRQTESTMIVLAQQELFKKAVDIYREGEFNSALNLFNKLHNHCSKDYLKRESLFFLASTQQRLSNYRQAVGYYKSYIEKYKDTNYYDESLYNLGLILNQLDNRSEAKDYLQRLVDETSDSIYLNSKVKEILN